MFPSLPEAGVPPAEPAIAEAAPAVAIPLAHGIYTLTPIPAGATSRSLREEAERLASLPSDQRLHPSDRPEKERVHAIACEFVAGHVRRITKGYALKERHRHFDVGTVVVSEGIVPGSRLRHATFQWAIGPDGSVVQLENARLPVAHLDPVDLLPAPDLASPHRGDTSDLAFLLASFCSLVGASPTVPVAATGAIALHSNQVLYVPDVAPLLEAAAEAPVAHVVLPAHDGKLDGLHDHVRYWPVQDANESIYSLLALMASEVLVPNLRRRALTKQAYSWLSLVTVLVGILGYQLAAALGAGGSPPTDFVRFLLVVIVVLWIGTFVFTHRYWRLDR